MDGRWTGAEWKKGAGWRSSMPQQKPARWNGGRPWRLVRLRLARHKRQIIPWCGCERVSMNRRADKSTRSIGAAAACFAAGCLGGAGGIDTCRPTHCTHTGRARHPKLHREARRACPVPRYGMDD